MGQRTSRRSRSGDESHSTSNDPAASASTRSSTNNHGTSFLDPWLRKGSPVSIGCMTFQKSDCAGHTGGRAGTRPRQRARKQPDAWTSWNTRVSEAIAVRLHRHLAWFLTVHIPGGFDRFTLAVGTPATGTTTMPPQEVPPDPAALAAIASSFGIEILGPPLTP